MTRPVVIPAELAEEVRQHPERFRPACRDGQAVILLDFDGSTDDSADAGIKLSGWLGRVGVSTFGNREGTVPMLMVDFGHSSCMAIAWALVGNPESPRPEMGDRVLVLSARDCSKAVGKLATARGVHHISGRLHAECGEPMPRDSDDPDIYPPDAAPTYVLADSWAILPEPPAPTQAAADLADDDQALTALSHAYRDTHDDATRSDAIGKALHSGWLAGRVSELRDLLHSDEVSHHPEWTQELERRLDALAEMAEVDGA